MEPLNGFQANVAPSEAAGLPANVLPAQAWVALQSMGAGCGGKYHVDGVYIILSVHKAGGRQSAWSCPGLRRPPSAT